MQLAAAKQEEDHFIRVTIDCMNNLDESLNLAAAKAANKAAALAAAARAGGATSDDVHDPTPPPLEGVQQRQERVAKWHAAKRSNIQLAQICRSNNISMKGLKAKVCTCRACVSPACSRPCCFAVHSTSSSRPSSTTKSLFHRKRLT
jgi:hypothetical protein